VQAMSSGKMMIEEKEGFILPSGFKAGGMHCGIKRKRNDLGYIISEVPAVAAGVYTTNLFQAAPLIVTQKSLEIENKLQAVLVNSGNANACTGEQGILDAEEMQKGFAAELGISPHLVAVTSTGVIGEMLPMDCIRKGISTVHHPDYEGPINFQKAILTTDTCVKSAVAHVRIVI
jgi:glutamate N-acetyltransferase / amino-acid N-acetyltransferase